MQVNRSMSSNRTLNVVRVSTRRGVFAALAVALFATASLQAAPYTIIAVEDSANPGSFTLNFGEQGGISSGNITSTDYGLEIDPVLGTAQLVEYYQEVESLTLFGQFPTGEIIVEVVEGTSEGTYDPETHEFTTTEMYAVYFTADLSAFGLESPVLLPSTSTGFLDLAAGRFRSHVDLQWAGVGQLGDPKDPVEFSYTCDINTNFTANAGMLIQLGLAPQITALVLPVDLEDLLLSQLDASTDGFEEGDWSGAANDMSQFLAEVDAQAGFGISNSAATVLIHDAQSVITLLRRPQRFKQTDK